MNPKVKYYLLRVLYFPFQLVIQFCLSPLIVICLAVIRTENQAFEDVYMTKDNPMLNQDGPTMKRKRKHWWITRFIGFDVIFED